MREIITRLVLIIDSQGYYEVVENPIDVIKIQQKLKTDEYANMDELKVGLTGIRILVLIVYSRRILI